MKETLDQILRDQLTKVVLVWCPQCKSKTPHELHIGADEPLECLKCGHFHK